MKKTILDFLTAQLDHYLADLRTLAAIDSGSDHKPGVDAVQDWLTDRLTRLGFACERHRQPVLGDNLLAIKRGTGSKRILLLGHADTVYPVGTAAARPVTITGNIIHGPGTCDMKAGLLIGLYAVEALQQVEFDDFGEIVFLVVSDEEIGPRGSLDLIRASARRVDCAFTLESARANGDIVTARKSSRFAQLEAFGKSAHAGVEPEKGRNAILALARKLDQLDTLQGFRPGITINVGKIEGGRQSNVVADYCKAAIDLRAWCMDDMNALIAEMRQVVSQPVTPGVEFKLSAPEDAGMPAMERTSAIAALEELTIHTAAELGFAVKGAATGGASDASFVAVEGTPVLDGLGPIGGLDHSPDEYIELDSIVPRTALLAHVMMGFYRG